MLDQTTASDEIRRRFGESRYPRKICFSTPSEAGPTGYFIPHDLMDHRADEWLSNCQALRCRVDTNEQCKNRAYSGARDKKISNRVEKNLARGRRLSIRRTHLGIGAAPSGRYDGLSCSRCHSIHEKFSTYCNHCPPVVLVLDQSRLESWYVSLRSCGLRSPLTHSLKETFETMLLWGVLLCDLGSSESLKNLLNRHPRTRRLVQTLLITAGLWAGSYPEGYAERAFWSQQLDTLNPYLFPSGSDNPKRWSSVAWHLISVGVWLSPTLKVFLSNKIFTWLGRNSFAVYLTHGTLLRVVLVKLVYGMNDKRYWVEPVEGGEAIQHWIPRNQSWLAWYLAVLVWFVFLYVIATLWTIHVDGWCARATRALEKYMFRTDRHEETNSKGLLG